MPDARLEGEDADVAVGVAALGLSPVRVEPIAGDASVRRFFRLVLDGGDTAVAAVYPPGTEAQVAHDVAAQRWGLGRGLPIPALLASGGRLIVSEDLGGRGLAAELEAGHEDVLGLALDALARFQTANPQGAPNPPFDATFFRRELGVFEQFVVPEASRSAALATFLDGLSRRVAAHPCRLVHRDFHADNLLLHRASVRAVDFQDMRGGPDTYDAVSLLCERAAADRVLDAEPWFGRAAERLGWAAGWPSRVLECRAQRGLKVLGTFRRLAAAGRPEYRRFEAGVVRGVHRALDALGAPPDLLEVLADRSAGQAL